MSFEPANQSPNIFQTFHSVLLDADLCVGCTTCIKFCPTKAIRVRNGKAKIFEDRCIDCGECIRDVLKARKRRSRIRSHDGCVTTSKSRFLLRPSMLNSAQSTPRAIFLMRFTLLDLMKYSLWRGEHLL